MLGSPSSLFRYRCFAEKILQKSAFLELREPFCCGDVSLRWRWAQRRVWPSGCGCDIRRHSNTKSSLKLEQLWLSKARYCSINKSCTMFYKFAMAYDTHIIRVVWWKSPLKYGGSCNVFVWLRTVENCCHRLAWSSTMLPRFEMLVHVVSGVLVLR